ncbi:MAG: hypothetical protein LBK94_00785 [Prevotellaceae bacterium]|jgi:hypothetical protein|nr:hypothetical protein [Prevotellaceae bacterium]
MAVIVVNGIIYPIIKTGGGIDENGNPAQPSETFGEPIPCRIKTNKRNNLGKVDGNRFVVASYEVLIDIQPFSANKVKLERLGNNLGNFSVISTDPLDVVKAIRILV